MESDSGASLFQKVLNQNQYRNLKRITSRPATGLTAMTSDGELPALTTELTLSAPKFGN
jgi:hypothetical protein